MAGEWIKIRTNLWTDPRVSQLCDLTDAAKPAVVGALYWLWSSADEHTQDGHMPGLSIKAIDRETGVPGIGAALVAIDWIFDTPGGVTLARFEEHNGASAKSRAQTAKRVAKHKGNAEVTVSALPKQEDTVSGALPREEKRREEKNKEHQKQEQGAARSPNSVDLSIAMRAAGVNTQPADPRLIALAAQGVEPETATAACDEAKRAKPNERIGAGYVFAILERWAADAAALRVAGASRPAARGGLATASMQVAGLDHSSTEAAMAASMKRMGTTVPDGEIEFN